jgi:uncharacterized protein YndB with AHSA1/START domain
MFVISKTFIMTTITVETTVQAPVEKVWEYWTQPEHIMQWSSASDDWHTPAASNDLREGGSFSSTMAAKDGSMSFDFGGVYTKVIAHKAIEYTLGDNRKVAIAFSSDGDTTKVVEVFEPETENSIEMQQYGWQSIMNNFKKYTEAN